MTDHAISLPRLRPLAPINGGDSLPHRGAVLIAVLLFFRALAATLRRRTVLRAAALGFYLDRVSMGLRRRLGRWGARVPRGTFRTIAGIAAISLLVVSLPSAVRGFDRYMSDPVARAGVAPGTEATQLTPEQRHALLALMSQGAVAPAAKSGTAAVTANAALPFSAEPVLAARAWAFGKTAPQYRLTALQCLAQAVYYEAGFEPLEGRRAVAQVVLNRVRHPAFAKSVCGVVYEGATQRVCQFSFTCDGSLLRAPAARAWREAVAVAHQALNGYVHQPVGHATHYHADYVLPYWAPRLAKIAKLGTHIFYRWPGGWGLPRAFAGRYAALEVIPALAMFGPADELAAVEDVGAAGEAALIAESEATGDGVPPPTESADPAAEAAVSAAKGRVSVTLPVPAATGPVGPRPEDAGKVDERQQRLGDTGAGTSAKQFQSIWRKGLASAAPAPTVAKASPSARAPASSAVRRKAQPSAPATDDR